jgi:hypothetical protein
MHARHEFAHKLEFNYEYLVRIASMFTCISGTSISGTSISFTVRLTVGNFFREHNGNPGLSENSRARLMF